jgi:hypothetical protein
VGIAVGVATKESLAMQADAWWNMNLALFLHLVERSISLAHREAGKAEETRRVSLSAPNLVQLWTTSYQSKVIFME